MTISQTDDTIYVIEMDKDEALALQQYIASELPESLGWDVLYDVPAEIRDKLKELLDA